MIMVLNVAHVRKFLVAVAAALGVAATALVDGSLDASEAIGVALAFLGAVGVYRVPNGVPSDV